MSWITHFRWFHFVGVVQKIVYGLKDPKLGCCCLGMTTSHHAGRDSILFLGFSVALSFAAATAAERHILFIAGPPSHGAGAHEHEAGSLLMAQHLESSGLGVRAEVVVGWPEDEAKLAAADAIVLYSDGLKDHVALGNHDALLARVAEGKGHVVIHFALEPGEPKLAAALQAAIGGHFEVDWSVNPMWDLKEPVLAGHAVTRGVSPFEVRDEFYYHMRFREEGVTPILQAHPPAGTLGAEDGPRSGNPTLRAALQNQEPQTLAWTAENPGGSRGFGFTGGHFHALWMNDDYRTLIVNAIAWTAGIDVPEGGVPGEVASDPVHPNIDVAIARGDLDDVKRHLAANPELMNKGDKRPPLPHAILRNDAAIALHLIAVGADVDAADNAGRTPLHLAVERNNAELCAALLKAGANPRMRDRTGWTPLHHAAARDRIEVARALLDGGADLVTMSEGGGTPLHEAAASGGAEMIQLFLDRGVDRSVRSKTNVTALDIAKEFKNDVAIRLLE
ncbi:MAG: ankyrin repeat domain-containing protein [Luteolibacter sp.]